MSLSVDFSYTDHTATFAKLPAKNTLLTTMNVFADRQTSLSPKVSLDVLDEVAQKVSKSVNRYGSEWTATAKRQSSSYLIEAPLHAYSDRITAADVQPYRKLGTDLQMSIVDAVTASSLEMYDKYMRTREKMLSSACSITLLKQSLPNSR